MRRSLILVYVVVGCCGIRATIKRHLPVGSAPKTKWTHAQVKSEAKWQVKHVPPSQAPKYSPISIHHHDELPQTVQVAKILAAQELIIWPRNQQLGRKPGKHVQDERRSQTSGVTQEREGTTTTFFLRQLTLLVLVLYYYYFTITTTYYYYYYYDYYYYYYYY